MICQAQERKKKAKAAEQGVVIVDSGSGQTHLQLCALETRRSSFGDPDRRGDNLKMAGSRSRS